MNNSISLIGMAGAGKTTVGKSLAKLLNYSFIDGDIKIEEKINQTIQNYLDQYGRKAFKEIEEEVLLSVNFNQTVLATGGSAVLSDTAMNFLRENSEVIYLEVSYETISERIFNLSERGVVRGPGQSLLETYNERLELYKRYADHVVKNNGTILCDDYNLGSAPGVKQAIDEFVSDNNLKSEIIFERFAKIEKN